MNSLLSRFKTNADDKCTPFKLTKHDTFHVLLFFFVAEWPKGWQSKRFERVSAITAPISAELRRLRVLANRFINVDQVILLLLVLLLLLLLFLKIILIVFIIAMAFE
jgi:hypothetical protein